MPYRNTSVNHVVAIQDSQDGVTSNIMNDEIARNEIISDGSWKVYLTNNSESLNTLNDVCALDNFHLEILGLPAFLKLITNYEEENNFKSIICEIRTPLCGNFISEVVICFIGFKKDRIEELRKIVNFMDGVTTCSVDEIKIKPTYLVANVGDIMSYKLADFVGIPILTESWIWELWSHRDDMKYQLSKEAFASKYKFQLFAGVKMFFTGFCEEETIRMREILEKYGGRSLDSIDRSCTHIVVNESNPTTELSLVSKNIKIFNGEWFRSVVQQKIDREEKSAHTSRVKQIRKRKLCDENLSLMKPKRICLYDITPSMENYLNQQLGGKTNKRYLIFQELRQTEQNYVAILNTIIKHFKTKLESLIGTKEQLLDETDIKTIFGNLIPIHKIHHKILESFNELSSNWSVESSIGEIILNYAKDMRREYPPFISFFENVRQKIVDLDRKSRFSEFLRTQQSKTEYSRQTLQDLFIRPVQRLPSVRLLLIDILKNTNNNNDDYRKLSSAIQEIEYILNHINQTAKQVALFELFNEIDNCPADLLSSKRFFIKKFHINSHAKNKLGSQKNIMFLFSDIIEICKKSRRSSILPTATNKTYQHKKMIKLEEVEALANIKDTNDFGLFMQNEEKYRFTIIEGTEKNEFVKCLIDQIKRVKNEQYKCCESQYFKNITNLYRNMKELVSQCDQIL